MKSTMERFIQQSKDSIECFDDHFSYKKGYYNKEHASDWIKVFILYLHMQCTEYGL